MDIEILRTWREMHHAAQSPHRCYLVMVPALLTAVENVLKLRYDDCPLGSTEGHEGWCAALGEVRDAIRDALGGAQ